MAGTAARPQTPVDLSDAALYADGIPQDAFARIRDADGLLWSPMDDGGFWAVTRHADVIEVSRDSATYSSAVGHIQAYRAAIRERTATLLNDFVERGGGDWVSSVAAPIPIGVICDILGVPPEDHGYTTEFRLLPFDSPAAFAMSEYAIDLGKRGRQFRRDRISGTPPLRRGSAASPPERRVRRRRSTLLSRSSAGQNGAHGVDRRDHRSQHPRGRDRGPRVRRLQFRERRRTTPPLSRMNPAPRSPEEQQ